MKPRWELLGMPATSIAGIIVFLIAGTLLSQVYVRKAVQGRARESADAIGAHYSSSETARKVALGIMEKTANVEMPQYLKGDALSHNAPITDERYGITARPQYAMSSVRNTLQMGITTASAVPMRSLVGETMVRGGTLGTNAYESTVDYAAQSAPRNGYEGTGDYKTFAGGGGGYSYGREPLAFNGVTSPEAELPISPVVIIQPVLPATGEGERVIRTADVGLEVKDAQKTYTQLSGLCQEFGGFLAQSNFYQDRTGIPSGVVTLRIPKDKFNTAIERIRQLGKVASIDTQSQDVSGQYADLESRLKAVMVIYDKMVKALEARKVTIPEAMQLESELTPITQRIAALKAEIEKLNNLTSFTTITVRFFESKISAAVIKENVRRAKETIVTYLLVGLQLVVAALPMILAVAVAGGIGLAVIAYIKGKVVRYFRNKNNRT